MRAHHAKTPDRSSRLEASPTYAAVIRSLSAGLVALSAVAAVLVLGHQTVSGAHTVPWLGLVALTQVAVVAAGALVLSRVVRLHRPPAQLVLGWALVVLVAMLVAGTRQYAVDVPVRVATMLGPVAAVASATRSVWAHACVVALIAAGWEVEHRAAPGWATTLTIEVAVFYAFMATTFALIRRTARTAERNIAELAETERLARAGAAVARERVQRLRTLHDTVLSTLTAVAHAVPVAPETLRTRCSSDLALLEQHAFPDADAAYDSQSLSAQLDDVVAAARDGGLDVDADFDAGAAAGHQLAGAAVDALVGGAREALANVARHAEVGHATLRLEWGATHARLTVRDEGRGFDPTVGAGVGLAECIHGRAVDAGGAAEITSAPGCGTEVAIAVPLQGAGVRC